MLYFLWFCVVGLWRHNIICHLQCFGYSRMLHHSSSAIFVTPTGSTLVHLPTPPSPSGQVTSLWFSSPVPPSWSLAILTPSWSSVFLTPTWSAPPKTIDLNPSGSIKASHSVIFTEKNNNLHRDLMWLYLINTVLHLSFICILFINLLNIKL